MHLKDARLCLDCELLHSDDQCPECASEVFAFVTQWIPSNLPRTMPKRNRPPSNHGARWLTGGAAGLAIFGVARWLSRPASPGSDGQNREPTDESRPGPR